MPDTKTEDNGLVTRVESESGLFETPYEKTVSYSDPAGNQITISEGADERGGYNGWKDYSAFCANGADLSESKIREVNAKVKDGFWFPGMFDVQDHDFGSTNPIEQACKVAKPPKPRKR
jgi:hypothetical protein